MVESIRTWWSALSAGDLIWLAIGLGGQVMFTARRFFQWNASEARKQSTMPVSFWHLSFVGGLMVLSYGVRKMDPVIILGEFGVLIHARNIFFIRRQRIVHNAATQGALPPAE